MNQPSLLCNRLDYSQFDWWLFLLQLTTGANISKVREHWKLHLQFLINSLAFQPHCRGLFPPTYLCWNGGIAFSCRWRPIGTASHLIPKGGNLWGAECSIFLASRLRCRTWSMMWTSTAKVNECASVKLLGSGSCGTWLSSCLAAGRIPRRPHPFIRPQRPVCLKGVVCRRCATCCNSGITPPRTLSPGVFFGQIGWWFLFLLWRVRVHFQLGKGPTLNRYCVASIGVPHSQKGTADWSKHVDFCSRLLCAAREGRLLLVP